MATQMTSARRGIATDEMKQVAKDEDVSLDWLIPKIARGSIIIPSNNVRPQKIHNVGIGKGLKTKVNVNIGTSTLNVNLDEEIEKAKVAIKYHADLNLPYRDKDGRLIDPVSQQSTHSAKKSPFIAAFFSSILPGLGKIYAGRTMDGVTGLWTMYLTSSSTYYSIKNQKYIISPLLGIITAYVYFGEIYGAWRAVKYYQKPSKSAQIKS